MAATNLSARRPWYFGVLIRACFLFKMDAIDGVDSSKPFNSPIKFTMIGVC